MPTYEAPIFIKSRQRTTNGGPPSVDTTGAVQVSRSVAATDNNPVTVAIPAGSFIIGIRTFVLTAATDAAMTVTVTGTFGVSSTAVSITSGALGANNRYIDVLNTAGTSISQAEALALTNIGTSDVTLSINTTSGAGSQNTVTVIDYLARNPNGTTTPDGQGLTNQ